MFKNGDRIIRDPDITGCPKGISKDKFYTVNFKMHEVKHIPYMTIVDDNGRDFIYLYGFIDRDTFIRKKYGFYVGQEVYIKDYESDNDLYDKDIIRSFVAYSVDRDMIICFTKNSSRMTYLKDVLNIEEYRIEKIKGIVD